LAEAGRVNRRVEKIRNEKLYDVYSSPNLDQIKKNETGGACGTYGRQETCIQGFGVET